ncbi:MAG: glutamate synthase subunit beta [Saprospiraceae bacterium]
MADPRGFLKYDRELPPSRDVKERIKDYKEIYAPYDKTLTNHQASRCMDCGVPFCHSGCPLGNIIPDFNDAVFREEWGEAFQILRSTNNFPEFTGRICPAPCEASCVLGLHSTPVTIEHIEKSIAEKAHEMGYYESRKDIIRTGKKVAVIGSGPSGLAAADQLNHQGHHVSVYERNDKIGGLLRYGIPDFKLEKWVIDRRLEIMESEGVEFLTNACVGENIDVNELMTANDALVLCGGSTVPRDLPIPGRELKGIHFAMEYLEQCNRRNAGIHINPKIEINPKGKNVLVIGGGDTGSDCVGNSVRLGANKVVQIELLSQPPEERNSTNPWPEWPMILRTSSSHEEGCERQWAILSKEFKSNGKDRVESLQVIEIEWKKDPVSGQNKMIEKPGTEQIILCDFVFLAMGYLHPQHKGMLETLGLDLDPRGNVADKNYQTSNPKVFSAGDMRRGQSLVVWAIAEGREAATAVGDFLATGYSMGKSRD